MVKKPDRHLARKLKGKMIKRKRENKLEGKTYQTKTGCGTLYITINKDPQGLFEVFLTMGKAGGCASSQMETIGRIISLALRYGIPISEIYKQLKGISCHAALPDSNKSCADAIGKILEEYYNQEKGDIK